MLSLIELMLPAAPQGTTPIATIGEFFAAGGFLMWPILGCSIVVVGLAIERYLSLRLSRVLPEEVRTAVVRIGKGEVETAAASLADLDSPTARMLLAGVRRKGHAIADVEKAMEDQLQKEAMRWRGNVRGIAIMAAISPLLGLLGTVLGISSAFGVVEQTGLGKSEYLASGIKVALYTTIFGLFVAIPATLIAAHLQGRVRRLLLAVSEVLSPAVDHLAPKPGEHTHAA